MRYINLEIRMNLAGKATAANQAKIRKIIRREFQKRKTKMVAEFLSHPVTMEINGGINADNISGTLSGIANLYSFIGFYAGTDPIDPILDVIQRDTQIKYIKIRKNITSFSINLPDPEDIFEVTPMPWATGRSWAKGIESGISGLGWYLRKDSKSSRSGFGLQSKGRSPDRPGLKFKNTKYISNFLREQRNEFQRNFYIYI